MGDPGHSGTLANRRLRLDFSDRAGRCAAVALHNHLSGRTLPLDEDDFRIEAEGLPALTAASFRWLKPDFAGERARLEGSCAERGVRIAIIYELGAGDFFVRRRLELTSAAPLPIRRVDAWTVRVPGICWSQEEGPPEELRMNVWGIDDKSGFGKPVLMEDTFWGLECPAGLNQYRDGRVTLTHRPGRTVSGLFRTKPAVVGVAPSGEAAFWFRDYIERLRPQRRTPAVHIDYNTWTTVTPATEANSLDLISRFRACLFDAHGVGLDSFTLDDGWDKKRSLWDVETGGFPRGLAPLSAALAPTGARLGLWLSPSSGYEHAGWGSEQGCARNATFDWFLCQSDPGYRREMCRAIVDLVRANNVGFLKMDGFCASCDTDRHAHHLTGDYAREANVDAFIELLAAIRQAQPDIHLDPTSGMWLSPWWLQYVDSLYCDTYDGTAPAIVPSPNGLDGATTSRDALLRRRLDENPGFDPAAVETLGIYLDPTLTVDPGSFFDNWQDNAMMVAGRGSRLLTMYMNPDLLPNPEQDWRFMAAMFRWVRHNADTLARCRPILGDPYAWEPYGYAHFRGRRGITVMRNPFIEPRRVRLELGHSMGWSANEAGDACCAVRVVYPHRETLATAVCFGDTVEVTLEAYQLLLLHVEEGEEALRPPAPRARAPRIGDARAEPLSLVRMAGAGLHLAGQCAISSPGGSDAWVYVLLAGDAATETWRCAVSVDGAAAEAAEIRSPTAASIPVHTRHELPFTPWVFHRIRVPGGRHVLEVVVECAADAQTGSTLRAGWWLWMEHPLEATDGHACSDPLPYSSGAGTRRQTVTLQGLTEFNLP